MYQITKETYGYEAPNANPWYAFGLWSTETFIISNEELPNWLNKYFDEYGEDFFECANETENGFETIVHTGGGNNFKEYNYIVKEI